MSLWLSGKEFQEIDPQSMYEADIEKAFSEHAPWIFPQFVTAPFKSRIKYGLASQQPDLVMVNRNFNSWIVVEVEKVEHSLDGHVLPQVESFQLGDYSNKNARAILDAWPLGESEKPKLKQMEHLVTSVRPKVCVVADAANDAWKYALSIHRALFIWIRLFRSKDGMSIVQLEGDTQEFDLASVVSKCMPSREMPTLWIVSDDAFLESLDVVEIEFQQRAIRWDVIRTAGRVYLMPEQQIRVGDFANVAFNIVDDGDHLVLRRMSNG